MIQKICKTCRKPKAAFNCGICHDDTCKGCTYFLDEATFSFLKKVPDHLKHTSYCSQCFEEKVRDPLHDYEATMERAKDINIFTKDQSKLTRLIKPDAAPLLVESCEDEQEAIVRLAFFAIQDGYNALMSVEIKTKKIIVGSHKKTIFNATGIPFHFDETKIRS
jgi:hypothetical protein